MGKVFWRKEMSATGELSKNGDLTANG